MTSKLHSLHRSSQADRESGFSLVEILVAVAILAILSATLSPLVIKFVNDGRRARALSDSQTIGQAILAFQVDTGIWPMSNDGNITDAPEISRLVGLPQATALNANIPAGSGGNTNFWQTGGGGNGAAAGLGSLEDHLVRNRPGAAATVLYTVSNTPPEPPGWNGPYLNNVPLDPWGRPYVCNVRFLRNSGMAGVTAAQQAATSVYCMSAGPDGVWNTPMAVSVTNLPVGDDIGWAIQRQVL